MLFVKRLDLACSDHCEAGCYMTGAAKCDSCDFGYGLNGNGSCGGMFMLSVSLQSGSLPQNTDDTGKLNTTEQPAAEKIGAELPVTEQDGHLQAWM